MENGSEEKEKFFQSKEYKKKYLEGMKAKEQEMQKVEIEDVFGNKVNTEELYKEISNKINNKKPLADIITDIVSRFEITKIDAMTAISYVNVVKHQSKGEGEKWGMVDKDEK